jgi:hypothetical protein
VAILPAFYPNTDSVDPAAGAVAVYHDQSECRAGQLILREHNQVFGIGARRRCRECCKYELAGKRAADAKEWRDHAHPKLVDDMLGTG